VLPNNSGAQQIFAPTVREGQEPGTAQCYGHLLRYSEVPSLPSSCPLHGIGNSPQLGGSLAFLEPKVYAESSFVTSVAASKEVHLYAHPNIWDQATWRH
jgi:hypothetical protein